MLIENLLPCMYVFSLSQSILKKYKISKYKNSQNSLAVNLSLCDFLA